VAQYGHNGHTPTSIADSKEKTVADDRTRNVKITALIMLVAAVAAWGADVVVNDFNLFTFGVFALVGVTTWLAWKTPRQKNAGALGVVGVGIVIFILAVFGIYSTRAIGAGMMLGSGFILLLQSIGSENPAR